MAGIEDITLLSLPPVGGPTRGQPPIDSLARLAIVLKSPPASRHKLPFFCFALCKAGMATLKLLANG